MARVFSGIQPTGTKHLGNYIGAIRHYVADQDKGEAFYCVVDLHAISVPYDVAALRENTLDTAATLLAAGLDADRCTLFVQSQVDAHPYGAWLLGALATFGELGRMTQFKEKSEGRDSVSCDLFTYPVLQAADILLYQADRVPVGDDQRQHLELARNIAQRFNSRFGELFALPEAAIPASGQRVMDLQDPTRKMSTTRGTPQGTVLVIDPPETVAKKVRSAVTDSGREVRRGEGKEGIVNLIEIMSVATGQTPEQIEAAYDGKGYGDFKSDVADAVVEMLRPVRQRYLELRSEIDELETVLRRGAEHARSVSSATLAEMKRRMGFE
ncbi:MAG TPA: tryptophan--tRNA ligase [Gaiellales bacterium]|jgi:tryptophanyl-tRNA synthetase|nr:tryptophan--tRNA ligase [Gaiellales bacterium]